MAAVGDLVGLLHRADWTRLSMFARVSDGSMVLVAPGRRYRYQAGEYVTGCDGGRPWELPGKDVDDEDGSVHWISGPEPPIRELLCPAWLPESPRLEVRGRARACGRDALDVVVTRRPSVRGNTLSAGLWSGPVASTEHLRRTGTTQAPAMPFRASPDRQLPSAGGLSRQRIANKQPRGQTAVSGDQASDLVAGAGFEPATSGL